jgi:hypothetical protein
VRFSVSRDRGSNKVTVMLASPRTDPDFQVMSEDLDPDDARLAALRMIRLADEADG